MQKKNKGLVRISNKQRISWRWTHNSSIDQSTKNLPIVKINYWTCFFTGAAVSVNWLQIQCPWSNGLQLQRWSQRSCFRFSRYFPFWRLTVFCIQFWVVIQISLLAICTYIRKMGKKFHASSSKDVKELCSDSQPSYMPSNLLPLEILVSLPPCIKLSIRQVLHLFLYKF